MYSTPTLADDVADLATPAKTPKINLYGISYGTRWALEVMRRHPDIVRSAILDGVYPPQINGDQNEPEVVRSGLRAARRRCARDPICKRAQSRLQRAP